MPEYVYGGGTLPATKSDLIAVPGGADATKYLPAADVNSIMSAIADLRAALLAGKYHGVTIQSITPPTPPSGQITLFIRSSDGTLCMLDPSGAVTPVISLTPISSVVTATGGTTPRGLPAWFSDVPNAKSMGAVGDGSTDDGPNLAAWITAVGSTATTFFFPPGNYKTNTNLIFPVTSQVVLSAGASFSGTGTITYNGDQNGLHRVFITDAASNTGQLVDLLHSGNTSTAYALDIHNYPDSRSAPTAGTGAAGAIAIHQYSDQGPAAVQLDNCRSQPAIILRNTHNETNATGAHGTGPFLYFVGYTSTNFPYVDGTSNPGWLGQLEGGTPGTPLTFASKSSDTPWAFRSDTTAPSLKITQSNAGFALQIATTSSATQALSITGSTAAVAVNISTDSNASGFYPLVVTGYNYGPKFTCTANSGPVLTVDQEVAGGNQVFYLVNKGAGLSIRVTDGTNDVFTVTSTGNLKINQHSFDYGTAAATTGTWALGDLRMNSSQGAAKPVGWACVTAGTPGTWKPFARLESVSADRGDTAQTLTVGTDAVVQRWATTLTANRVITLSTTGAADGDAFRVVRTGLGAFTIDVGGLKTIPSATAAFVDVAYNGAAWVLTGYGTL